MPRAVSGTRLSAGAGLAANRADLHPRQLLLSVWCSRPGEFAARAVLDDGSVRDFRDPFELVRFLSRPAPPAGPTPGLR